MRERLRVLWGERQVTSPWEIAAWTLAPFVLTVMATTNQTLADSPFFFVAHGVSPRTVAVVWVVCLTLALVLLALVTRLGAKTLNPKRFDLFTSILTAAIGFLVVGAAAGWVVGALLVLPYTWLTRRIAMGKVLLGVGTVVALVPLVTVSVDQQDFQSATITSQAGVDRPNVLWLIPDTVQYELLFDSEGRVRPAFPNLRELQDQSTTYTNAYATANGTSLSVPSMLNGVAAVPVDAGGQERLVASSGLASWLTAEYDVNVYSAIFPNLCTAENCRQARVDSESTTAQMSLLLADMAAVAGRGLQPGLADRFPDLEGRWRDFWGTAEQAEMRASAEQNADGLIAESLSDDQGKPQFVLWHFLDTHEPFDRDLDGEPMFGYEVDLLGGLGTFGANFNGSFPSQESQRLTRQLYIAELVAFDARLGALLDDLEAAGAYEDLLFILTSDHARSFANTEHARLGDDATMRWNQVAHVPLMVKAPGQVSGEMVAQPRSTAQIAQTVLREAGLSVETDDPLAPSLDQEPAQQPQFLSQVGSESAPFAESRPADLTSNNPWDEFDFSFVDNDYPFAATDPDLVAGKALPGQWQRFTPEGLDPRSARSEFQLLGITAPSGKCTAPGGRVVVTEGDRLIAQVLWDHSDLAPEKGSRGWAIVPVADPQKFDFWCQPAA